LLHERICRVDQQQQGQVLDGVAAVGLLDIVTNNHKSLSLSMFMFLNCCLPAVAWIFWSKFKQSTLGTAVPARIKMEVAFARCNACLADV